MPVGCSRADAGRPRGIGEGESRRAFLGDQTKRRLQQRLLQIAVMIAALGAARFLAPAHVNGFYMTLGETSLVSSTPARRQVRIRARSAGKTHEANPRQPPAAKVAAA